MYLNNCKFMSKNYNQATQILSLAVVVFALKMLDVLSIFGVI